MGTTKILFFSSLLLAVGTYWLTSPVPDGYSFSSTMEIRKTNALLKIFGAVARVSGMLGNTEYINISRSAEVAQFPTSPHPDIAIEDAVFDNVPVSIYRPVKHSKQLPGFVYYHGGGWVLGSVAAYHELVIQLCRKTDAVFVSVDYRLAPEHVYPAAFDDSLAATKYFLLHAKKYNVDPHRIAIGGYIYVMPYLHQWRSPGPWMALYSFITGIVLGMTLNRPRSPASADIIIGDSAGGNLAAAVSLRLRDENFEPKVKMQVLIYPALQSIDYQLPSMITNANGPILTRRGMAVFLSFYLAGSPDYRQSLLDDVHVPSAVKKQFASTYLNVKNLPEKYLVGYARPSIETGDEKLWDSIKDVMLNPYFSPLLADDVSRLPMAYVFTCEHDVLRDEAILYVHRLREVGNAVTHTHSDIGYHGILSVGLKSPEAEPIINQMTKYIVDNL